MITRDMILRGIKNGVVKLIDSPNDGEPACKIGDAWFYYAGEEGAGKTSEEYVSSTPIEDISNEIVDALNEIRDNIDPDEYRYYEAVLTEAKISEADSEPFRRSLELSIRLNADSFEIDVYEPESGENARMEHPYSFDEHPEFDAAIGAEIYSWLSLWKDEQEEGEEA